MLLQLCPTSLHPSSANPPEATPLFILQRHNTTKWMHLNISADTNNKCTNKDSNIAERNKKKKKKACMEHKFSKRHSWACVFLFIHSLYNQADVWRADHNPVYEKRVREKTKGRKSNLICNQMHNPRLTAAPYCIHSSTWHKMHNAGKSSKQIYCRHLGVEKKCLDLND